VQHLERHAAIERAVERLEHRAHAAAAELAQHQVPAELVVLGRQVERRVGLLPPLGRVHCVVDIRWQRLTRIREERRCAPEILRRARIFAVIRVRHRHPTTVLP